MESAREFARWRTKFLNDYRKKRAYFLFLHLDCLQRQSGNNAASGRDNEVSVGNPYTRNSRGCVLANFKPGRGNYVDDGVLTHHQ